MQTPNAPFTRLPTHTGHGNTTRQTNLRPSPMLRPGAPLRACLRSLADPTPFAQGFRVVRNLIRNRTRSSQCTVRCCGGRPSEPVPVPDRHRRGGQRQGPRVTPHPSPVCPDFICLHAGRRVPFTLPSRRAKRAGTSQQVDRVVVVKAEVFQPGCGSDSASGCVRFTPPSSLQPFNTIGGSAPTSRKTSKTDTDEGEPAFFAVRVSYSRQFLLVAIPSTNPLRCNV